LACGQLFYIMYIMGFYKITITRNLAYTRDIRTTHPDYAMNRYDDAAKLVLRLTIGILLLMHGLFKLSHGVGGIMSMVAAKGWPTFIAYGAYLGEVAGPVLLILGLFTRPAAVLIVIHMVAAIVLAHMHQLGTFTSVGGWSLELQALFLFGAFAVALQGAGRYSLSSGRYN